MGMGITMFLYLLVQIWSYSGIWVIWNCWWFEPAIYYIWPFYDPPHSTSVPNHVLLLSGHGLFWPLGSLKHEVLSIHTLSQKQDNRNTMNDHECFWNNAKSHKCTLKLEGEKENSTKQVVFQCFSMVFNVIHHFPPLSFLFFTLPTLPE